MIVPDRSDALAESFAIDALLVDARAADVHVSDVTEALLVEMPDDLEGAEIELEPGGTPQPRRHLRVAPDGYRRRRRVRIAAAAAGVSISITLFAVVGFNVMLAQHQIELQSLQRKLQTEESRYYDLRDEVAQRSSPRRIVSKASSIGLVRAPTIYLSAAIPPPAVGPTATAEALRNSTIATRGSLDHPVP